MSLFKKKSPADQSGTGGGDSSMFGITLEQCVELMKLQGKELTEKVNSEHNGVKGILEKLKVDGNKGLDSNNKQDFEQRQIAYGKNEIPQKPMKSFIRLCWDALHDMLLIILLVCAIVSIGLSFYKPPKEEGETDEANIEWIEGVAILVAVLVVILVTAFNDWRKERQFRALEDRIEKEHNASVIRDNSVKQVAVTELVVGDLCFIKYGDVIPADGLVVQASDLKVDESSLTGETDLAVKGEKDELALISGTSVMEGSGRMIILGVGINSNIGRSMCLINDIDPDAVKGEKGEKGKKGKKGKDKDKKKKGKKSKSKSSTKVSPDTSKPDENEGNTETIHIEKETKSHPRTRKLPPLKQSNVEEQELQSTKKENNNNEQKKETSSNENINKTTNNDQQEKKKSSSNESINKKSNNTENENEEQKKESTESGTSDEQQKKKSTSGENNDDENQEKKSSPKENEKVTETKTNDNESEKKSNKNEGGDEEQEKKSEVNKQKQDDNRPTTTSSTKPKTSDDDKKGSKANEENDKSSEKKPAGLPTLAQAAEDDEEDEDAPKSKDGKSKSVLQAKLTTLALYIGYIGMAAAVLTLICLIIRFCITTYIVKKQAAKASDVAYFISFLIQAITVVVVSVPEGLPLAVTLALAFAVRNMMTDNNLVRYLDACETMGNASTICSDKTGTLTTNRMTVVQSYIFGKYEKLKDDKKEDEEGKENANANEKGKENENQKGKDTANAKGKENETEKGKGKENGNEDPLSILFEAATVNSNYTTSIEKPKKDEGGLPKQIGNKTECALLDLVNNWGGSYEKIRERIPENKLVKVYTFNSAKKMMSTLIQREEGYRIYTKGAVEMVLNQCTSIIGEDHKPKELNDAEKKKIKTEVIEKMAHDALRVICIAYRDLGKEEQNWDDEDKIIKDLTCIAIVGIEDPVRKEVPGAIEQCQKAGVTVRMVTGDNIATARAIALKCGIIKPDDDFLVLEGKEFNQKIRDGSGKISQKKLDEIWPRLRVLARSSPTDKYNLVNGIVVSRITKHREVVAVTGDGTNDGPALKRADVGFAMGIQGTDVAKSASDIILTDDNFASIVKAMMWGRNVYDCIAKFLQFQLTANLSAGVISVVSAAAISSVPLRAVQMLWVNIVMDTLASLALATEPPTLDLLNRKPYGRTKSIISALMMRNILGHAVYQLTIMFIILYTGQYFLGVESTVQAIQQDPHAAKEPSQQFTLVFNAFVLMTLFNEINARKLHGERNVFAGILKNPFFYIIWISCLIAQILIVTFGGRVVSCVPLDIKQWAWCVLFGIGSLLWQQVLLCIPIEPFTKCFSAMFRVCCPCIYKKKQKADEEEEGRKSRQSEDKTEGKRSSRKKGDDEAGDDADRPSKAYHKYSTIGHLANSTVVTEPPPMFARYMLRKSVTRLNTEFQVINEFRSRLDKIKDARLEENFDHKRNSQADILEEED